MTDEGIKMLHIFPFFPSSGSQARHLPPRGKVWVRSILRTTNGRPYDLIAGMNVGLGHAPTDQVAITAIL